MGVALKVTSLVAALISVALGVGLITGGPVLIRYLARQQLPLVDPTRHVFRSWANANYDGSTIIRRYYFWNLTNPWDVHDKREAPNFRRVGPFAYREKMYNTPGSIFWKPDGLISSTYHHDLFFDAELSVDEATGLPLDPKTTHVTNVNMPLNMLAHRISSMPPDLDIDGHGVNKTVVCDLVDLLMGSGSNVVGADGTAAFFSNRTIHELLFRYKDPLFEVVRAVSSLDRYSAPTVFQFEFNGSLTAPSPYTGATGQKCPCWDDLSICNQTGVNPTEAFSGADWSGWESAFGPRERQAEAALDPSLDKLGSIHRWAGQDKMWWWGSEGDCQKFEGSLATLFPPGLDEDSTPYVFVDAMYRKTKLQYSNDAKLGGIPVKRFVVNNEELQFSPNSKCYDQKFVGLFNLTAPLFGPMFTSGPFFYNMPTKQALGEHAAYPMPQDKRTVVNATFDDVVAAGTVETVDGRPRQKTQPVFRRRADWDDWTAGHRDISETYADIFGEAGVLLQGAARIQTNSWLKPVVIKDCPNVFKKMRPRTTGEGNATRTEFYPETLAPLFYVDREASVSDSIRSYLKTMLVTSRALAIGFGVALIFVGVGAAVATVVVSVVFGCDGKKRKDAAESCNQEYARLSPDEPVT